MLKKIFNSTLFLFICFVIGCNKENPITSDIETLVFQREGVIESLGGDCSAVQIRTSSLGNLDFNNTRKVKFQLNGFSDADLSSISIYYVKDNENVNLVNLPHRDEINSTQTIEVNSPDFAGEVYLRVTLKSSVCTGQIFHLEVRDLNIYTIR